MMRFPVWTAFRKLDPNPTAMPITLTRFPGTAKSRTRPGSMGMGPRNRRSFDGDTNVYRLLESRDHRTGGLGWSYGRQIRNRSGQLGAAPQSSARRRAWVTSRSEERRVGKG